MSNQSDFSYRLRQVFTVVFIWQNGPRSLGEVCIGDPVLLADCESLMLAMYETGIESGQKWIPGTLDKTGSKGDKNHDI